MPRKIELTAPVGATDPLDLTGAFNRPRKIELGRRGTQLATPVLDRISADMMHRRGVFSPTPGEATPPPSLETAAAPEPPSSAQRVDGGGDQSVFRNIEQSIGQGAVSTIGSIIRGVPEIGHAAMDLLGIEHKPTEETRGFRIGEALRRGAEENFQIEPEFEDSTAGQISSGLGSTIPFFALAPLGPVAGTVGAGALGASANATQTAQEAIDAGRPELRDEAALGGAVVGTTEALPVGRLLQRLDRITGGIVRRTVTSAIKGGAENAIQEVINQVGNNLIANGIVGYDPERGTFEGTLQAGETGAEVGAILNGLLAAAAGRRGAVQAQPQPQQAQQPQPQPAAPASPPAQPPTQQTPPPAQQPAPTGAPQQAPAPAPSPEVGTTPTLPGAVPVPPQPPVPDPKNVAAGQARQDLQDMLDDPRPAAEIVEERQREAEQQERAIQLQGQMPPGFVIQQINDDWQLVDPNGEVQASSNFVDPDWLEAARELDATFDYSEARRMAGLEPPAAPPVDVPPMPVDETPAPVDVAPEPEPADAPDAGWEKHYQSAANQLFDGSRRGRVSIRLIMQTTGANPDQAKRIFAEFRAKGLITQAGRFPERKEGPVSLAQFIISRGGANDVGGDLRAMDAVRARPGLINQNGPGLDYHLTAAIEAGYLPEGSTIADLLDVLDDELRGKPRFIGEEVPIDNPRLEDPEYIRFLLETEAARLGVQRIEDLSTEQLQETVLKLAEAIGGDDAADMLIDEADRITQEVLSGEWQPSEPADEGAEPIPFPPLEGQSGGRPGEADELAPPADVGAGSAGPGPAEDSARDQAGAAGDEAPAPQELETEQTDQGEQTLVPGVAPVTDRDRIQVAADRPLEGGNRPMDEGLFDTGARSQGDIFDQQPAPAAPEPELNAPPSDDNLVRLADRLVVEIQNRMRSKAKMRNRDLFLIANEAFGGTQAENAYTAKDAYDAMELAINKWIAGRRLEDMLKTGTVDEIKAVVAGIDENILPILPTQSERTEEQVSFQQFSTPPHYAAVVAWAANIDPDDRVLEPSAGTGGIAVWAVGANDVWVNELAERRVRALRSLPFDAVFSENAEQLNNVLPADVRPTVVIMNPPFSQTAGRMKGKRVLEVGANHIEQALKRLEPGGRLVAIVGRGMGFETPTWRDWWREIGKTYTPRANIAVSGDVYTKYGTHFATRVLVIDKTGPLDNWDQPVKGEAADLPQLIDLLAKVRDARTVERERPADQSGGESRPGADRVPGVEQQPPVRAPADAVGPGDTREGPRPADVAPDSGTERGRPAQPAAESGDAVPGTRGRRDAESAPAQEPSTGRSEPQPAPAPQRPDRADDGRVAAERVDRSDVVAEDQKRSPTDEIPDDAVYETYQPARLKVPGAKPHPTDLVESAAMASVLPPKPTYKPTLPKKLIESGIPSEPQIEAVVYAGQAHEKHLPNGQRRGFFIGDGTGVGKGTEAASIILDNWNQGRKRHVWMSKNKKLLDDARRDWKAVGGKDSDIFDMGAVKLGDPLPDRDGILFVTYDTLKVAKGTKTRIDQLKKWAGDGFEGVIIFDEAHKMGNALDSKGSRGVQKASATALVGVKLQNELPEARVVYASATGATEIENLAYAERLGLWGKGTPFPDKQTFINEIGAGGVAAMELVALDLKQRGLYLARNLSFRGVGQETLEHSLSAEQTAMYDEFARSWQIVLTNVNEALKDNDASASAAAKSAAMAQFWSGHQRFFNAVLTAMQMPSVLRQMEADLDAGHAIVAQLVSTNEAAQERAVQSAEDEDDLTFLDLSPKSILLQYLENSFPTQQYEEWVDEDGNTQYRPVVDSEGKPVQNADSVRRRDELLERLGALQVPDPPLEQLLNHFGTKNVAEATGRSRRFVRNPETGRYEEERRGLPAMKADIAAFLDDKKRILVFSDAGGTGASYHADPKFKNGQRKRIHYLIQAGWQAATAVQGFGRSHRSNQTQAPLYRLVTTDLKGHKRFISTIARRLDQLGALTKGQRQTGGQGMFRPEDNLESSYASDALGQFWRLLYHGRIPGFDFDELTSKLGFGNMRDPKTGGLNTGKLPGIPQFLNRLLSLEVDEMNRVFDAFSRQVEVVVEDAKQNGTLDVGVETIKSDRIEKTGEQVVYTDPETGAETKLVSFNRHDRIDYVSFDEAKNYRRDVTFWQNKQSGQVWANIGEYNRTESSGRVVKMKNLMGPAQTRQAVEDYLLSKYSPSWREVGEAEARAAWEKQTKEGAAFKTRPLHMLTGTILPIWDRLDQKKPRIYRMQDEAGDRYLGRQIPPESLSEVLKRLGATPNKPKLTPAEAVEKVLREGWRLTLANQWIIKRVRIQGETFIEIEGPSASDMLDLKADDVFTKLLNYRTRFFIPTDKRAADVIAKVTKYREIVDASPPADEAALALKSPRGVSFANDPKRPRAGIAGGQGGTAAQAVPRVTVQAVDTLIDRLTKTFGATVRQGRIRIPKAEGTYSSASGIIRAKNMRDIRVVAHEIGHHLEDHYGDELRDLIKGHAAELIPLDYEPDRKSKTIARKEGFAEFFRYYVTNYAYAGREAPRFMAAFESFLQRRDPEAFGALQELRDHYREWLNAPSDAVVSAGVVSTDKGGFFRRANAFLRGGHVSEAVGLWARRLYTFGVDRTHPIFVAVQRLSDIYQRNDGRRIDLKIAENPYALARLAVDAHGAGYIDVMHGIIDYETGEPMGASLAAAINTALGDAAWTDENILDFGRYLYARRAIHEWDRFMRGEIPNEPTRELKADHLNAIREFEARYPNFAAGAAQVYEWANNLWAKKYRAGLITKDAYEKGLAEHPDYVPFMRDREDLGEGGGRGGTGRTGKTSIVRRFLGSDRRVINPLESLIRDAYVTERAIADNEVKRTLYELALKAGPGSGTVVEKIKDKTFKPVDVVAEEVRQSIIKEAQIDVSVVGSRDALMLDAVMAGLDSLKVEHLRFWKPGEISEKGEPIVYLWQDGKRIALRLADGEFGRELYETITGLGSQDPKNPVMKLALEVASAPARLLRLGITSEPSFLLANLIRDLTASFILVDKYNPITGLAKGLKAAGTSDKEKLMYIGAGGLIGGANVASFRNRAMEGIRDLKAKRGLSITRVANVKTLAHVTEVSETAARLGIFKSAFNQAKNRGLTQKEALLEAAYAARDYLDFGRSGSGMLWAKRVTTFLNVWIQGVDKAARVLGGQGALRPLLAVWFKHQQGMELTPREKRLLKHSARAWANMTMVGLVGLMLSYLYRDDEEYKEFSEYIRATHWMIRTPLGWFAAPKPFELGVMANIFERAFEAYHDQDPTAWDKLGRGLVQIFEPPHIPTIIEPVLEYWANKSFFDGRPIVPDHLIGVAPEQQYTKYTSSLARFLGETLGMSPIWIDHFIIGYGGTWARSGLALTTEVDPNAPSQGLDDWVFTRRFFKDWTRGAVSREQFYDEAAEQGGRLTAPMNVFRDYLDQGRFAEANKYIRTLDEPQRIYAAWRHLAPGEHIGVYTANRVHPIERSRDYAKAIYGVREDMRKAEDLTGGQKRRLEDLMAQLIVRDMRNSLITIGTRGYANRKITDLDPMLAEIRAISPAIADLIDERTEKLPPAKDVYDFYPTLKEDAEAFLADLAREQ